MGVGHGEGTSPARTVENNPYWVKARSIEGSETATPFDEQIPSGE
jgi:hypothetical protein